tara:strand:- start:444 stop:1085 length:642 start_codon:yes stop_codon:yes gene_type:complete
MTNLPTASTNNINALVTEFAGGAASDISMMIGVGLVKDTDAVFFQYLGEGVEPMALVQNSGRPLTRLGNVKLAGISIAEDVGEFNSTKLNVVLESTAGTQVLVTSGLTTIWSQCLLNGLEAMRNGGDISCPFNLDTWKGTSKMRPCFAAVRVGQVSMKDNDLYTLLADARADGNKQMVEKLCRNAVTAIYNALTGGPVEEAVIADNTVVLADF